MPLYYKTNANAGAVDSEPVPGGSHVGICDLVADLGLQPGSALFPAAKPQTYIRFELPHERIESVKNGKKIAGPALIGKTYTASMHEKAALRHDLESWRGKQFTDEEAEAFDIGAILGKPCMLTVMHVDKGGKTYANITAISPLPKGLDSKSLKPEIPTLLYTPDSPNEAYDLLPGWLQKKIDNQLTPEKPLEEEDPPTSAYDDLGITDDDVPF